MSGCDRLGDDVGHGHRPQFLEHCPDPTLQLKRVQALIQSSQRPALSLIQDASRQEALVGRRTLAPEATQALLQAAREGPPPGHDLTPREHEVLALMVEGLSNPEIAERLVVSLSTARAHVSNIVAKLGAANRAEAVALAFRHNLIA